MSSLSVFDVLGPEMIGPSSSHTAGACRIGLLARKIFGQKPVRADFILYGSFARTFHGHGTDRALLGGILGFDTNDPRIRNSFQLAVQEGITYSFQPDFSRKDIHPNTADILLESAGGSKMSLRGESTGGGRIRITRIDNTAVDFTGEYNGIITMQKDLPGVAAHVTQCLSRRNINIAFMRLYRSGKHENACMIVETDDILPPESRQDILGNANIRDVMIINRQET